MTQQHDMFNSNIRITNDEINEILQQHDSLILYLARKNIPRNIVPVWKIDMEIDDLAQNIRSKLWTALQRREIYDMKSYIRGIVRNEIVNMVRQHEPTTRLVTNDDGEPSQTFVVVAASQEAYDPVENVELDEMLESYSSKLTQEVVKLPLHQRHAMICTLKDQIADLLPLADMFSPYEVDVESLEWPEAENELRSSRVSLSIARKKLRASKENITW